MQQHIVGLPKKSIMERTRNQILKEVLYANLISEANILASI